MAAKPKLRTNLPGVNFNDNLTVAEQHKRRQLVPVNKLLRSNNVRCRLERGSLIMDGKGYFSPETVRAVVRL